MDGDSETLGIAGGICKRRWYDLGQFADLKRAAEFYERGAEGELGDDAYARSMPPFSTTCWRRTGDDPAVRATAPRRCANASSMSSPLSTNGGTRPAGPKPVSVWATIRERQHELKRSVTKTPAMGAADDGSANCASRRICTIPAVRKGRSERRSSRRCCRARRRGPLSQHRQDRPRAFRRRLQGLLLSPRRAGASSPSATSCATSTYCRASRAAASSGRAIGWRCGRG